MSDSTFRNSGKIDRNNESIKFIDETVPQTPTSPTTLDKSFKSSIGKATQLKFENLNEADVYRPPTRLSRLSQSIPSIHKSNKNKQTNLDYILSLIGSFGLYQKIQFILVGFLAIVPSMAAYCYVFIAATPKFTCILASERQILNYDDTQLLNTNQVYDNEIWNDNHTLLTESIRLIRIIDQDRLKNKSEILFDNSCQISIPNSNRPNNSVANKKLVLKCLEWLYDDTIYGRTIVTDWNLVCMKSYFKALTQNAYIMGTACAILSGIISDKLGRKTALMLMITLMAIVLNITQLLMHQTMLSNTKKFIIFTISRFFQGFGQTMYAISFVLLMEITGPQHRVLAGNIMAYSFAIGQIILVSLAYYLRDWRKIMWSLAVYVMPFFTYYWLVPESPRWLLSKDKVRDAKNVLKKISLLNNTYNLYMSSIARRLSFHRGRNRNGGTHNSSNYMSNYLKNKESSVYIHSLLQEEANKLSKSKPSNYTQTLVGITKSRALLKRCFILFYIWMVTLMVYLVQAICEFLGIVTCHLVLNRYGRKKPLIIFMFLSAIVIFLIPIFYDRYPYASGAFYLIAKYSISAAQLTCMIFTSELYPTPMRSTGVGLSATISRLGGVWAPQINVLSSTLGFYVPYIVFSSFALIAGFLTFILPETLNKNLPENVVEAEKMDKEASSS